MRNRAAWVLLAVLAGLLVGGCRKARQQYEKVSPGMTPAEVREILGAPRYEFADEWVYTGASPSDLARVTVYFSREGGESRVVGKSWRDPQRPSENHQEGQVP